MATPIRCSRGVRTSLKKLSLCQDARSYSLISAPFVRCAPTIPATVSICRRTDRLLELQLESLELLFMSAARARQPDRQFKRDRRRPTTKDQDTVGQIDGLADVVGDKQ